MDLPVGTRKVTVECIGGEESGLHESYLVRAGIPWSKIEFVAEALRVQHPHAGDPFDAIGDYAKRAMAETFRVGPSRKRELFKERLSELDAMIESNESAEAELHMNMEPNVRKTMRGKKVITLRQLLEKIFYPDEFLWQDLSRGMPGLGRLPETGAFPLRHREATVSEHDLMRSAREYQQSITKNTAQMTEEVIQRVRAASIEESMGECSWLRGPFSPAQIEDLVGPRWIPIRRFGIVQGEKLRLIDDGSEFGVNAATTTPEKIDLGGVDEVIAVAMSWSRAVTDRSVAIKM